MGSVPRARRAATVIRPADIAAEAANNESEAADEAGDYDDTYYDNYEYNNGGGANGYYNHDNHGGGDHYRRGPNRDFKPGPDGPFGICHFFYIHGYCSLPDCRF